MGARAIIGVFVIVVLAILAQAGAGLAQDAAPDGPLPDLVGEWTGQADFLLPGGVVEQVHRFHIVNQNGLLIDGVHHWTIINSDLTSHDGIQDTLSSAEPFLGVVGHDQSIWVVEEGDTTMFRLMLLDDNRLAFIALEGGQHPLAAHGILTRE